ncbi:MAG: CdaR family protein [bacterium]|nr:CdaR family protein [bacterium]
MTHPIMRARPIPASRWSRFLTEDAANKFLALALAFVLWVTVTFLGSRTVTAEAVPVSVSNLRDDLAVASPLEPVRVRLRAPRTVLRERGPNDLVRAFVDLTGRGIGAQSAEVTVVPTDSRANILIVLPSHVNVTLDPVVQRSLPITVTTEGEPAAGYRTGDASVDPATVQVRGALGRLQATSAIEAVVPVGGATASFDGEVPLRAPEGLKPALDRVHVKLEIIQAEETKTLGVRVVTSGNPAPGYWVRTVTTDPAVITVRGPRGVLESLSFIETAPLRLDGARALLQQTLDLALPDTVAVVGGEPTVRVQAEIVSLEGTKDIRATIQVNGVPDGLRVTAVSPNSVRITVQGSAEALDRLRDGDIVYFVSASGRDVGAFTVQSRREDVRAPENIRTASVENIEISVTLER